MVEDPHPVFWAHISMLLADIKCLDLLLQSDLDRLRQWQYFINQPGTSLPTMKIEKVAEKLHHLKGACDSVVHVAGKRCPLDSIFSIRNASFDSRFHFQFALG